ncbi:hypothetical protein EMCG_04887 [[Emmonsia] crescens]|uniref:Restriction endonuclease domain-containing protein n=1 Tax=[Emmonsia] crescens TaxID=73230 RepID=A0A0G2HQI5_9EURO|nr:hypothetical protein EMCG_04887 [Emmonsia crescens UAMH 3008]
MDTHREFLQDLPSSTSEYEFKGVKDILKKSEYEYSLLEHDLTKGQFIIFNNVPPETIDSGNTEAIGHLFSSYHMSLKILIIKMPLRPHEVLAREFDLLLVPKARQISEIFAVGSVTVKGTTRSKAPNCAYQPETFPAGRDEKWPSVVLEIGLPESRTKLERDCHWWLNDSRGEVKIALGISINRTRKEIIIKRWELQRRPTRGDPNATAPMATQEIAITSPQNSGNIIVDGAPLILEFAKMFLRQPVSQADIQITQTELETLAQRVWTFQGS